MKKYKLCAPCLFGLEGILKYEAERLGFDKIETSDGRVYFEGDDYAVAAANLWFRTAERVEIVVASFEARSFEELFCGTEKAPWENFISKTDAFPVVGWSVKSELHSVPDCQSIIKKAIVNRLSSKYGIEHFEESGPTVKIRFSILKDCVTIMLDTSGEGLHKRGWRAESNAAPLKETLAAGIVDLARLYPDSNIYDPFCGSGTLAIESALRLENIAPGLNREFSAQKWGFIDKTVWKDAKDEALALRKTDTEYCIFASDIDPKCVELTKHNINKAGVSGDIRVVKSDISDFNIKTERGVVITNPPYGQRLLDVEESRKIYETMGRVFACEKGKKYYIISNDEEFENYFSRRADRKRKLYNGMIKCQLYMYYK